MSRAFVRWPSWRSRTTTRGSTSPSWPSPARGRSPCPNCSSWDLEERPGYCSPATPRTRSRAGTRRSSRWSASRRSFCGRDALFRHSRLDHLDPTAWLIMFKSSGHGDHSILIERACWLCGTKMAQHRFIHIGFIISVSLMDMSLKIEYCGRCGSFLCSSTWLAHPSLIRASKW